jgi:Protein of unknown function (DUF1091)
MKIKVFRIVTKKQQQLILVIPKINYCDLQRGSSLAYLRKIRENFYKFGNLSQPCPYKSGYYNHRGLVIDDSAIPGYLKLLSGKFLIRVVIADESRVKTGVWLLTLDLYLDFFTD